MWALLCLLAQIGQVLITTAKLNTTELSVSAISFPIHIALMRYRYSGNAILLARAILCVTPAAFLNIRVNSNNILSIYALFLDSPTSHQHPTQSAVTDAVQVAEVRIFCSVYIAF